MRPTSSKPTTRPQHTRQPSNLRVDKDGWYNSDEPQVPLSVSTARPLSSAALRPSSSAPLRPPSSASMRPSSSAAVRSSQSGPVRPPSSASVRPASSASVRPSSSASVRPTSSASARPPSSASGLRPGSSASTRRPISRFSHRAPTRQSTKLLSLCESLVTQVTGLTSANDMESFQVAVDYVSKNLDSTVRPSGSTDFATIDKVMRGYAKKARINSADILADGLDKVYAKLKTQLKTNNDLDSDIQRSRVPDHLKFLTFLSSPPTALTLENAEAIIKRIENPEPEKAQLTWKDILAEEPFEGQHWEGVYGLHPGSTVEHWETRSDGSTPSLSPWDSESDLDKSRPSSRLSDVPETPPLAVPLVQDEPRLKTPVDPSGAYRHRQDVEELHSRQYWRPEWRSDAPVDRKFNLGDASSLAPALHRVLGSRGALSVDGPAKEKYRHEQDIVREVLTGLQGRRNMMFTWVHSGPEAFSFVLSSTAPRLLHFTAGAQDSIISSFAALATALVHLRKLTAAVFAKASASLSMPHPPSDGQAQPAYLVRAHRRSTQTLEAFADALDKELRVFDAWCAHREEEICHARSGVGPKLVVSLLSLEKSIRDAFGAAFPTLLDIVRTVVRRSQRLETHEPTPEVWTLPDLPRRTSPSTITALLLDALLIAAQEHVSMSDTVTARALVRVFGASMEPLWAMMHKWMRDGMPVRDGVLGMLSQSGQTQSPLNLLQDEFFIEDNEMLMIDPDFWTSGFALRDGQQTGLEEEVEAERRPTSVPVFLVHVAELVLATGKVTGLLRAMGISTLFDGEQAADGAVGKPWMADWRTFSSLLQRTQVSECTDGTGGITMSAEAAVASSENLSRIVYDELCPYSEVAHEALTKVLVEDCDLWVHLHAIEDLFLMRRGDAMSHFVDILFNRMDSRQPWNDFHFMNSAFRDVVALYPGRTRWIDSALVRFSFPPKGQGQGGALQEKSITQTVRALDGLLIEYAVPFPLTYIFGPRTMRVYSSIFTLVLQVRRAKSVLERILVRGGLAAGKQLDAEMKVFYAMRGRLSWFVNTLLNFITTHVLHTQVLKFHEAFRQAKSLDEMIHLQNEHLDKLEGRCLLQRNTVALHRAIMSILDMSLHYTDTFVSFAGDATHDISRASLHGLGGSVSRHHRSRRLRKLRRDVIGFAQAPSLLQDSESSSDEEGLDEESLAGRSGREPSFSLVASTTASFMEDGFLARLDKMSGELDALVRFVRRGVESLAAGTGEAAPAFGIFAFALEDWDR